MRNILLAIALATSTLAVGCATPSESACNKADECGTLGEQTVEQCIADTKEFGPEQLRAKKREACDKIADAWDELYSCVLGHSCSDIKEGVAATECKQAQTDLEAAGRANGEACGVE